MTRGNEMEFRLFHDKFKFYRRTERANKIYFYIYYIYNVLVLRVNAILFFRFVSELFIQYLIRTIRI